MREAVTLKVLAGVIKGGYNRDWFFDDNKKETTEFLLRESYLEEETEYPQHRPFPCRATQKGRDLFAELSRKKNKNDEGVTWY